jgi:phosphatidylglycerophosphate synthase
MKAAHEQYGNGRFLMWTLIHSFCFLTLGTYTFFFKVSGYTSLTAPAVTAAAAAAGACSFAALMLLQGRSSVTVPNAVSLLRLVFTIAAVALLSSGRNRWGVFMFFALAGLTDFFDGLAARRLGSTPFGAKLDMELDAFFIFMLAIAACVYYQQKQLVLVAGLLRYAYVFLLLLLPETGDTHPVFRFLSKGACALAEMLLIIITAPPIGTAARSIASLTAVYVLCASFFLDLVLRVLRGSGDAASSHSVFR